MVSCNGNVIERGCRRGYVVGIMCMNFEIRWSGRCFKWQRMVGSESGARSSFFHAYHCFPKKSIFLLFFPCSLIHGLLYILLSIFFHFSLLSTMSSSSSHTLDIVEAPSVSGDSILIVSEDKLEAPRIFHYLDLLVARVESSFWVSLSTTGCSKDARKVYACFT